MRVDTPAFTSPLCCQTCWEAATDSGLAVHSTPTRRYSWFGVTPEAGNVYYDFRLDTDFILVTSLETDLGKKSWWTDTWENQDLPPFKNTAVIHCRVVVDCYLLHTNVSGFASQFFSKINYDFTMCLSIDSCKKEVSTTTQVKTNAVSAQQPSLGGDPHQLKPPPIQQPLH